MTLKENADATYTINANRRHILGGGLALAGAATMGGAISAPAVAADAPVSNLTPQQALDRLKAGNQAFITDRNMPVDISARRRLALATGQSPFAALVGCADSRVGPEHLFGAGLGELFIVRTAGNYVDDAGFGSLAYAVSALKVPLIVVLGHQACGAVAAATSVVTDNAQLPPALTRMVQPILPAVIDARANQAPGEDLVDKAIIANAKRVASGLRSHSDPIVSGPVAEGKVMVVAAYYELSTGKVTFYET